MNKTIREYLKIYNLSAIAEEAELSPQSLNYHLNKFDEGGKLPLDLIIAIAEIKGVTVDIVLHDLKLMR